MLIGSAALLLLAGCGQGGEDFAVEVERSPAQVIGLLREMTFTQEQQALKGFRITMTRPNDHEIVYTIPAVERPGKPTGESVIRLTLDPVRNGAATTIHAAVDVPPVRIMMGQPNKVLSEVKVERELRTVLRGLSSTRDLRSLLSAVAIASNVELQSQMNTALKNGGLKNGGLDGSRFALGDDGDDGFAAEEERFGKGAAAEPMDDPEAALERRREAEERAEQRERESLHRASAPMDDTSGRFNEE
ncbi:MAG: hypothetical protein IT550_11395 [Novosphingobium sp.]|jgi:hypothetical protein|nr:hypothetical protein [Novosphingobium sp.]